jgi:hypothetical protein
MKKITVSTIATAGLAAVSLGLASPALADGSDSVPVATGNDTSLNTPYRTGGPQGTPIPSASATVTVTGGPADQLPAASPGANPFVPLGPGH